jgi:hypothetical protein
MRTKAIVRNARRHCGSIEACLSKLTDWSGTDVMIFKIISPKNLAKIGVFDSKQSYIMQNFDHSIGF